MTTALCFDAALLGNVATLSVTPSFTYVSGSDGLPVSRDGVIGTVGRAPPFGTYGNNRPGSNPLLVSPEADRGERWSVPRLRSGCCGGWVGDVFFLLFTSFFLLYTSLLATSEKASGVKALKAHAPFGVCAARPGGLCAVTLGCTWLRPPAGAAGFFLFHSLGWRAVAPSFLLSRTF